MSDIQGFPLRYSVGMVRMRDPRFGDDEWWEQALRDWRESGMTMADYADSIGVSQSTWARELREHGVPLRRNQPTLVAGDADDSIEAKDNLMARLLDAIIEKNEQLRRAKAFMIENGLTPPDWLNPPDVSE